MLVHSAPNAVISLTADVSDAAVGAVTGKCTEEIWQLLAFFSQTLIVPSFMSSRSIMLCCEFRGRSLNLSGVFSATRFFWVPHRGCVCGGELGSNAPQGGGLGGGSPCRKFQPLALSFCGQKYQNWVASGTGVISTNDIGSALVPKQTVKT